MGMRSRETVYEIMALNRLCNNGLLFLLHVVDSCNNSYLLHHAMLYAVVLQ